MKFTSAVVFCVLATSAFGGVIRASYAGNAGNYAGQPVQHAPAPAPYTATAPAPYTAPAPAMEDEKCWMETKKCCWVEKEDGYECRDNYDTKMARCNKKYSYEKKCDEAEKHGQVEKPEDRIDGTCEKVRYDQNYGPHMAGYPSGMSETYHSKKLPTTPYKVDAEPYAPYPAPAPATSYEQPTANGGYTAPAPANGY